MKNLIDTTPGLLPILDETAVVSSFLWERGWAERNAGNLSVDITELLTSLPDATPLTDQIDLGQTYEILAGRVFLVTGTGRRFRDCARGVSSSACILTLNDKGDGYRIIWGGNDDPTFRPTSEFPSHLRIHEHILRSAGPCKVVLHTHPSEIIALSHLPEYKDEAALNQALWRIHPEVKVNLPVGIGLVKYTLPGTEELAMETIKAFETGHPVALWQWHGVVSVGRDVGEAFDLIDTVNKAAKLVLLCRMAGCAPKGLSDGQLDDLERAFITGK